MAVVFHMDLLIACSRFSLIHRYTCSICIENVYNTKWPFVFKLIVPSTDLASSPGLIKKRTVGRPAWERDYH